MRFEAQELPPYAEPVDPSELRVGGHYFAVQFIDENRLVPSVEPLVYLGHDLEPGDTDRRYFQDAESFRDGVRIDQPDPSRGKFWVQSTDEVNHIFTFERALDVLLRAALKRRARGSAA